MKTPPKQVLIAGGIAVALGGIYLIRKKEQASTEEFIPTTGPTTYVGSQEAAGNFGNFGGGGGMTGGGAPTSEAPKVIVVRPPHHGNNGETQDGKTTKGYQDERRIFEKVQKGELTEPKATPHPKTFHPV